jgi:peptidoglycan hydrolase-like protein with peptidoglycan-binding domain
LPDSLFEESARPFSGVPLRIGSTGEDVKELQSYLNLISEAYPQIQKLDTDGVFGPATEDAVIAYQNLFGYTPNGVVGVVIWNSIANLYQDILQGMIRSDGQFPGYDLKEES